MSNHPSGVIGRCWVVGVLIASTIPVSAKQANVVVVYTDDQQFRALAANGAPGVSTPILDALASRGVRFTQARAALPVCSPSRATLLTGQYASANGVANLNGKISPSSPILSRLLRDAGYSTCVTGKWHVQNSPSSLGFDRWAIFHSNGDYYKRRFDIDGARVSLPREGSPEAEHVDFFSGKIAAEFVRSASVGGKPFFLWHNTQTPHLDGRHRWNAKSESVTALADADIALPGNWDDTLRDKPRYYAAARNRVRAFEEYGYEDPEMIREHTRDYYAVTRDMDQSLGALFAALEDPNGDGDSSDSLNDSTYVIMMSDNGWLMGDHGMTSKAFPFDASARVPLLVSGPGVDAGRVDARQVMNLDIAPTILEIAGVTPPAEMHGRSLLRLLHSAPSPPGVRDVSVVELPVRTFAGNHPILAAYDGRWELLQNYEHGFSRAPTFSELYDLSADPWELENLADAPQASSAMRKLQNAIDRHLAEVVGVAHVSTARFVE